MNFVIVISYIINTIPNYLPVVLNMPKYPRYIEIAKKFDILYCEVRLETAYDQVQIYLDFWAPLGRANRTVDLSSAWPRDQLNSAQTILALLGISFAEFIFVNNNKVIMIIYILANQIICWFW